MYQDIIHMCNNRYQDVINNFIYIIFSLFVLPLYGIYNICIIVLFKVYEIIFRRFNRFYINKIILSNHNMSKSKILY